MKRITVAILAVFLLLGLAYPVSATDKKPIIIGTPLPFSGPMSMYGEGMSAGIAVAIDEINAGGGVLGRPFKLIKRDTRLNPETGVREVKDIILNENGDFIVGVLSSGVALAVSEYCKSAKKIFICTGARTTRLTEEKFHPYVFRFTSSFNSRDGSCLDIAARTCEHSKALWKKLNPNTKVVAELWPPLGTSDWSPYISKLMASGGNILIHSVWGGPLLAFDKQAIPMGLYKRFHVVGTCAADLETTHVLTKESPVSVGIITMTEWPYWALKDPKAKELAEKFMKKINTNYASPHSYMGYLAVYALKRGIEKAGGVNQEKIIKILEGMDVPSTMGTMRIRACDHQLMWPVYAGKMDFISGAGWPSVPDPIRPTNVDATYGTCEEIYKIRENQ
jgi:branched-chain amino acid transport system substrate-binding protein